MKNVAVVGSTKKYLSKVRELTKDEIDVYQNKNIYEGSVYINVKYLNDVKGITFEKVIYLKDWFEDLKNSEDIAEYFENRNL